MWTFLIFWGAKAISHSPRPPLKIFLFSFTFSRFFFSSPAFSTSFLYSGKNIFKKNKKTCGLSTGHYYGHLLDREQTFALGRSLTLLLSLPCSYLCSNSLNCSLSSSFRGKATAGSVLLATSAATSTWWRSVTEVRDDTQLRADSPSMDSGDGRDVLPEDTQLLCLRMRRNR